MFVKEYYKENDISCSSILVEKYYEYVENQIPKLLKEKSRLLSRVTQIDEKVTQIYENVTQNNKIVTQILREFKKQGRDIDNVDNRDRFWIKSQLEKNNVTNMDVDGFLSFCKGGKNSDEM